MLILTLCIQGEEKIYIYIYSNIEEEKTAFSTFC